MLDDNDLRRVIRAVQRAEQGLLRSISRDTAGDEDDMTGRLAGALEQVEDDVDGVRVMISTTRSAGAGSAETVTGADICGVISIVTDEITVAKGFLAQAKRAGSEGCDFAPYDGEDHEYSHWLYRGSMHLPQSGTVRLTKPSPRLAKQCLDMLARTPDAFVWVYHEQQVAVVAANGVLQCRAKRDRSPPTPLGTKTLSDFFVHLADCFVGDPSLEAWDDASLLRLRNRLGVRLAFLLEVDARADRISQ